MLDCSASRGGGAEQPLARSLMRLAAPLLLRESTQVAAGVSSPVWRHFERLARVSASQ